jgi:hypothetical protein
MSRSRQFLLSSSLITVLLVFTGTGWAQPSGSPDKDEAAAVRYPTLLDIKVRDALPDGPEFVPANRAGRTGDRIPVGEPEDVTREATMATREAVPLWPRLEALGLDERLNARLALEFPERTTAAVRAEARAIDTLWNSGDFAQALGRLRALEESGQAPGLAVAIAWRVPRNLAASKWTADRLVSPQASVKSMALDFDEGTANHFVALAYDDPDPGSQWSVNISTNDGLSWSETYTWYGEEVPEVHGRVGAGYFWVAYVTTGTITQSEARVRRFAVADGAEDAAYSWTTAFDRGVAIEDLSVETNADSYDNRVYVVGLLADDTLVFYWANATGTTWNNIALAVTDAESDLDAHWNTRITGPYFVLLSYRSTINDLHVVGIGDGGADNLDLDSNATGATAVAAFEDRILTAYEHTDPVDGESIRYRISYDGGNTWAAGWIVSATEDRNVSRLDLAARKGGGFACVFGQEVGEPDQVWYTRREYGTGPGTAAWVPQHLLNEVDLLTGSRMALEYLPPTGLNAWAHGAVWVGGGTQAWFDLDQGRRLGTATIANGSPVSVFTVPDRSGDPLTNCYLYGGTRTNATITVRVTDDDGNVLGGVPAENLALRTTLGGLHTCTNGAVADGPTNAVGITTFTVPVAGGFHSRPSAGERTRVYVDGVVAPQVFNMAFNSPDANGDLQVSLVDVPPFAAAYFGAYDYAFDYRWDGALNITDVALFAGALGASCPPAAALATSDLAVGTMGIYFDEGAGRQSLNVAPREEFEAYLLVTGPAAGQEVRGWQCELSLSDNLVVRDYVYATESINLLTPPRFMVGTASPCPAAGNGSVRLLTLRLQVIDDRPAYIHLNRSTDGSGDVPLPLVALGAEAELGVLDRPNRRAPAEAVATINDPSAGWDATSTGAGRLELTSAPNPFNPATEITCRLPAAGPVDLTIYDAAGRRVALLASGHLEAGEHTFRWTGRDEAGREVGSGVYFAQLESAAGTVINKMVMLR